jgi:hypothetical protein
VVRSQGARQFSKDERRYLAALKLPMEKIEALEKQLPRLSMYGAGPLSQAEMRAKIQSVSKPIAKAIRALEALELASRKRGPGTTDRVAFNGVSKSGNGPPAIEVLRQLAAQCAAADIRIKLQGQARRRARPQPISMIAEILGWDVSRVSHVGAFSEIAEICYRAAGLSGGPTRAIRNFRELKRRGKSAL